MNKTLKVVLIILAVLIVGGGLFAAGAVVGRASSWFGAFRSPMMLGYNQNDSRPYMMQPGRAPQFENDSYGQYGMGPGMMYRNNPGGNYGPGQMGPGMMNRRWDDGSNRPYGMGPGMMQRYGQEDGSFEGRYPDCPMWDEDDEQPTTVSPTLVPTKPASPTATPEVN